VERGGRGEGWEGNRIEGKGRQSKGRGGRKREGEGMDAPGAGPPPQIFGLEPPLNRGKQNKKESSLLYEHLKQIVNASLVKPRIIFITNTESNTSEIQQPLTHVNSHCTQ
jgi:hypothetical protein